MGDCGRMSEHNTPDIPFRQPAAHHPGRLLAAVVRRHDRLDRALAGDGRHGDRRLPADRLGLHRRHDHHAAPAADGPVRRLPRRLRRTVRPAADAGRHGRAPCPDVGPAVDRRLAGNARSLAFRGGELRQRLRLGDRQSAPPHHHGRGHGPRSHGHGDGARCRRRQFQPHGRPDGRRPAAGRHRHRRRLRPERGAVRHGDCGHADGAHPHARNARRRRRAGPHLGEHRHRR